VLLLPIGACDDSAHSTNEKFNHDALHLGPKVLATYLEELAALEAAAKQ
jgi:acetylornithine deacetylase/succinyl-diaminopimelate desuccinylase-like protein